MATRTAAPKQMPNITGVVVSAGKMHKTVKVRVTSTVFNKKVQKLFATHRDHLVHDPSSSARLGDVVTIQSGYRASVQVRHVLSAIVAPVGESIETRPAIPSIQDLLAQRKEERSKRDGRLLGVADAVQRLRTLEEGRTAGMDEKDIQDEMRHLRERKDIQDGVRKGINGALKRVKEAAKMRWRTERATIRVGTADALKVLLSEEAAKWDQRTQEWYGEAYSRVARGKGKWYQDEIEWRAGVSAQIAYDVRSRIADIDAYLAQVDAFTNTQGDREAAETALLAVQEQVLRSLCNSLTAERGVYIAELENLQIESNWLYSLQWLKDPSNPWRWQSHRIRLQEDGAMNAEELFTHFSDRKIRNGPVWYAAMREAMKLVNPDFVEESSRNDLQRMESALQARRRVVADFSVVEGKRREALQKQVEVMRNTKPVQIAGVPHAASTSDTLSTPPGGKKSVANEKREQRAAKRAAAAEDKALTDEKAAQEVSKQEALSSTKTT